MSNAEMLLEMIRIIDIKSKLLRTEIREDIEALCKEGCCAGTYPHDADTLIRIEAARADIEILKLVVAEHSKILSQRTA